MTARCTNSEPGTFNHECGKPAIWAGTHPGGHVQNFCEACKASGYEARPVVSWRKIEPTKADIAVAHVLRAIRDDGRKAWLLGYGTQTFALLTEAYAEANGLDVEQHRREFWSQCRPQRVAVTQGEGDV